MQQIRYPIQHILFVPQRRKIRAVFSYAWRSLSCNLILTDIIMAHIFESINH